MIRKIRQKTNNGTFRNVVGEEPEVENQSKKKKETNKQNKNTSDNDDQWNRRKVKKKQQKKTQKRNASGSGSDAGWSRVDIFNWIPRLGNGGDPLKRVKCSRVVGVQERERENERATKKRIGIKKNEKKRRRRGQRKRSRRCGKHKTEKKRRRTTHVAAGKLGGNGKQRLPTELFTVLLLLLLLLLFFLLFTFFPFFLLEEGGYHWPGRTFSARAKLPKRKYKFSRNESIHSSPNCNNNNKNGEILWPFFNGKSRNE